MQSGPGKAFRRLALTGSAFSITVVVGYVVCGITPTQSWYLAVFRAKYGGEESEKYRGEIDFGWIS